MKLPKEDFALKVGPHTYNVIYTEDVAYHGGFVGRCDVNQLKIYLKPDLPESVTKDTFVHEVLHSILNLSGLDRRLDDTDKETTGRPSQEDLVNEISPLLLLVLEQNPEIFNHD